MSGDEIAFTCAAVAFFSVIAISILDSLIASIWNWVEDGNTARRNYIFRKIYIKWNKGGYNWADDDDVAAATVVCAGCAGVLVLLVYYVPYLVVGGIVGLGIAFVLRLARRQQKLLKSHIEDKKAHK